MCDGMLTCTYSNLHVHTYTHREGEGETEGRGDGEGDLNRKCWARVLKGSDNGSPEDLLCAEEQTAQKSQPRILSLGVSLGSP